MFINPQMGANVEAKAHRARNHGYRRSVRWEGMGGDSGGGFSVQKMDGGGAEEMSPHSSSNTEVTVEKLG
jgi:hypothetical protein